MNHHSVVSNEHMDNLPSPYKCISCGEGSMIQAVQQGESEDTENYLCERCHYRDNIPTSGVLFSQFSSSIFGLVLCLFLFYRYALASESKVQSTLEFGSLTIVIISFIAGFVYVIYKASRGYKIRRGYLKG